MKTLLSALVLSLIPCPASAQTVGGPPVTPTGNEIKVAVAGYDYVEPGDLRISIHGPKFGGEYLGAFVLDRRSHLFTKADARFTFGNTAYDGWCAPWLITPNSASPNGYRLGLGVFSPCDDSGNRDWYVEARGLVGKDVVGKSWTWSPETGLGVRRLSNSLAGIKGFRKETYLYLPVGLTARTRVAGQHLLGLNLEFDVLLRGWQTTYDSALGSGGIPATPTAPAFTINGFTDLSFEQHRGWAVRASAKYQVNKRLSVEPYFLHWRVDDSTVSFGPVSFTVNGVTAGQQLGAYEPLNTTREFGVKLGIRF